VSQPNGILFCVPKQEGNVSICVATKWNSVFVPKQEGSGLRAQIPFDLKGNVNFFVESVVPAAQ